MQKGLLRVDLFIFLARCFIEKSFNFVQWAGNLARGRRVNVADGGRVGRCE